MASPTGWTWVWVSSGSWWWTGKPGVLQSMGSQSVRHDWATELKLKKASQEKHRELTWAGLVVLWAACSPWRLPRWLQPLRLMWPGLQGILAQRIFKNFTIGGSLDGEGVQGRRDTCICMAESLHCSSETITILLIGYTPIQNKKFKLKKNFLRKESHRWYYTNNHSLGTFLDQSIQKWNTNCLYFIYLEKSKKKILMTFPFQFYTVSSSPNWQQES